MRYLVQTYTDNIWRKVNCERYRPLLSEKILTFQKRLQHATPRIKEDIKTYTQDDIEDNIKKFKAGNYETIPDPEKLAHFK